MISQRRGTPYPLLRTRKYLVHYSKIRPIWLGLSVDASIIFFSKQTVLVGTSTSTLPVTILNGLVFISNLQETFIDSSQFPKVFCLLTFFPRHGGRSSWPFLLRLKLDNLELLQLLMEQIEKLSSYTPSLCFRIDVYHLDWWCWC